MRPIVPTEPSRQRDDAKATGAANDNSESEPNAVMYRVTGGTRPCISPKCVHCSEAHVDPSTGRTIKYVVAYINANPAKGSPSFAPYELWTAHVEQSKATTQFLNEVATDRRVAFDENVLATLQRANQLRAAAASVRE